MVVNFEKGPGRLLMRCHYLELFQISSRVFSSSLVYSPLSECQVSMVFYHIGGQAWSRYWSVGIVTECICTVIHWKGWAGSNKLEAFFAELLTNFNMITATTQCS